MTLVKKHPWMLLIPVLWLATWLAARMLNYDAIWFDEYIVYDMTGTGGYEPHSLIDTFSKASLRRWPPGYYILFQMYEFFFGGTLFLDRLLSTFFGLIGIAATYQIGKQLYQSTHGAVASILLASSVFATFYNHELRGYSFYWMSVALSIWFYLSIIDKHYFQKRWIRWGFVLSTALSFYTHYIAAASFVGLGVYHLLFQRKNPNFKRIVLLAFNACLLFSPWIGVAVLTVGRESLSDRSVTLSSLLNSIVYSYANNLFVILIPCIIFAIWRFNRRYRFLLTWLSATMVFALVTNIWVDYLFHPRHIAAILAPLMVLTGAAIVDMSKTASMSKLPFLALGIWVGVGIVASNDVQFMHSIPRHVSQAPIDAVSNMVNLVASCIEDNDYVLLALDESHDAWISDFYPRYYFQQSNATFIHLASVVTNVKGELGEYSVLIPESVRELPIQERIDYFTDTGDRIWLFSLPDLPIQDDVAYLTAELVQRSFSYCEVQDDVDLYAGVFTREAIEDCTQICQMGTSN